VILDLRGNGGGYLPMAVELASFFLPKNELVTTAKYTILPDEILRSKGYAKFVEEQVVVLIDGMSASASEIVAGALQQRRNAKLVGTTSF
jgi:carboxyl-terminal processing protease